MIFDLAKLDVYIALLRERITHLTGLFSNRLEPFSMLCHQDGSEPPASAQNPIHAVGDRAAAALVCFNVPAAVGETRFPLHDLTISPSMESTLIFAHLYDDGRVTSLHASLPVCVGSKRSASQWLRERLLETQH